MRFFSLPFYTGILQQMNLIYCDHYIFCFLLAVNFAPFDTCNSFLKLMGGGKSGKALPQPISESSLHLVFIFIGFYNAPDRLKKMSGLESVKGPVSRLWVVHMFHCLVHRHTPLNGSDISDIIYTFQVWASTLPCRTWLTRSRWPCKFSPGEWRPSCKTRPTRNVPWNSSQNSHATQVWTLNLFFQPNTLFGPTKKVWKAFGRTY